MPTPGIPSSERSIMASHIIKTIICYLSNHVASAPFDPVTFRKERCLHSILEFSDRKIQEPESRLNTIYKVVCLTIKSQANSNIWDLHHMMLPTWDNSVWCEKFLPTFTHRAPSSGKHHMMQIPDVADRGLSIDTEIVRRLVFRSFAYIIKINKTRNNQIGSIQWTKISISSII